jgi:radical SAM superfamily enzyme YgiQ (UPF0313 family)
MNILLVGINSKFIHPAMGIMQLAANASLPVMTKEFTIKDDYKVIVDYIVCFQANLVGLSVYIWNAELVKQILQELPSSQVVVVGGPEASYRVLEYFLFPCVKFVVKNEGEDAFNELLHYLQGDLPLLQVANLYYKNEDIHFTYDALPDISKIKHDYTLMGNVKNRYVYLESSRGCPYSCSYCLASLEKQVRFFPLSQVKAEILLAINSSAQTVKFLDRTFNVDEARMLEILEFIKEHDNQTTVFQFEVVAEILTDKMISFLKTLRFGLVRFEIGIQSTNESTIKAINRHQYFEKLKQKVAAIKENIVVHLDLIAGLPYEDLPSLKTTFNKALLMFPNELQLGILKALAGTQIVSQKHLYQYVFSPKPPYEIISNSYLSTCDLQEVKLVELGLNKYYNSHRFPKALTYLLSNLNLDPYKLFLTLGNFVANNPKVLLQTSWLSKSLSDAIAVNDQGYFLFLIKQDYLEQSSLKPPIWWKYAITKAEKSQILMEFKTVYPHLTSEIFFHHSRLEKWETENMAEYFFICYQPRLVFTYHKKLN